MSEPRGKGGPRGRGKKEAEKIGVQKIWRPFIALLRHWCRRARVVREEGRGAGAQRAGTEGGSRPSATLPPPPLSLPPLSSSSYSFILSFSVRASLKQQVPTPLLRGSRLPSGFLLPLPVLAGAARRARSGGEVSAFRKIQRIAHRRERARTSTYLPSERDTLSLSLSSGGEGCRKSWDK